MTGAKLDGFYLLLIGAAVFILAGTAMEVMAPGSMADFKTIYYPTKCLLHHGDPYDEAQVLSILHSERKENASASFQHDQQTVSTLFVYLPTASLCVAPIAILPWEPAHLVWMIMTATGLILAASLVWNFGASFNPVVSGALTGFLMLNSVGLLLIGNAAGVAVSLCILAVWSFLNGRFVLGGVICLAISLALKPHDAGLVWLFFLLSGGSYRRRALQTLAVTALLGIAAILWISHFSPNWFQELEGNLAVSSAHGGLNDPRPDAVSSGTATMVLSLQSAVAVFQNESHAYNIVTYLICGPLLLIWVVLVARFPVSPTRIWLALAAISALSMLPIYHRPHDAKLLLLAVPACAMLWDEGGLVRWVAFILTMAAELLTGSVPLAMFVAINRHLHVAPAGSSGKMLTLLLGRPAPLILLATGVFYLWLLVRRSSDQTDILGHDRPGGVPLTKANP